MNYEVWNAWKKEDILANGVKVWHKKLKTETALLCVIIDAGSKFDGKLPGISHFTEHMLFQGTKKYPDEQVKFVAAENGISMNAATSKEFMFVEASTILPDKIEVALDLCKELVVNPIFPEDSFNREKKVVLSEIGDKEDAALALALENARALICEDAFKSSVLGTHDSIKNSDVKDMVEFHRSTFSPERVTICYAGSMDIEDFVELCSKKFGGWKKSKFTWDTTPAERKQPKHITQKSHLSQTAVLIAYPGVKLESDDSLKLKILCDIVGGGAMISRMFRELRNKRGLCYFCTAMHQTFHNSSGLLGFCGSVSANNVENFVSGLREILQDILSVAPITEKELATSKTRIKSNMLGVLDNLSDAIDIFIYLWTGKGDKALAKDMALIDKITLEDIKEVAEKYLSQEPELFLVGNIKASEEQLNMGMDPGGYVQAPVGSAPAPVNVDRPTPAATSHAGGPNKQMPSYNPGNKKVENMDDILKKKAKKRKEEDEEEDPGFIDDSDGEAQSMDDIEPTCVPTVTRNCDYCGQPFEHLDTIDVKKCPDCKVKDIDSQQPMKRVNIYSKEKKCLAQIVINDTNLRVTVE